jgi:Protein of unknown function (DUF3712)
VLSIESKVMNTGPVAATQAAMTVDLIGPKGIFGRLDLPEVKTKSSGTDVTVTKQLITIVDLAALQAFVQSIQLDEQLTLHLDNGKSTIKAMGMTANIIYKKEVHLKGMNGPKTEIVTTVEAGAGFKNSLKIINPSPLEIDLGETTFEYIDEDNNVIAVQRGRLNIPRGESLHEVVGEVKKKGPSGTVRLVGKDVEKESWLKETVKYFDAPIVLTPELTSMVAV